MPERLPIRDRVAGLDQTCADLDDVARILGAYRRRLIAEGIPPEDALELCLEVQGFIVGGCE
jgi:hypothetical protein